MDNLGSIFKGRRMRLADLPAEKKLLPLYFLAQKTPRLDLLPLAPARALPLWPLAIIFLALLTLSGGCVSTPEDPTPETPDVVTGPAPTPNGVAIDLYAKYLFHINEDSCSGVPDTFDVYFVDTGVESACLKKWVGQGKKVIAYMSAGSAEDYRDDWSQLKPYCNKAYAGYPNECWLDIKRAEVLELMKKRLDKIKAMGFSGVYYDNGSVYQDGKDVSLAQNTAYLAALGDYANSLGLLNGPNAGEESIPQTVGKFQFYVGETLEKYGSIKNYDPVVGKYPIFDLVETSSQCTPRQGFNRALYSSYKYSGFKKFCNPEVKEIPETPSAPTPSKALRKGRLPKGLDEASGLAYNPLKGEFYLINDSGNAASLWVLDDQLKFKAEIKTGLKNEDWEAVAYFDGKVYIGDIGDNGWDRKSKKIYVLDAFNFKYLETLTINLKSGFDTEGMAIFEGKIYLLDKDYGDNPNELWRVEGDKLIKEKELIAPKGQGAWGDMSINSKGEFIFPAVDKGDGTAFIYSGGALKKISIQKLGQIEAMTWTSDRTFVYTTEGNEAQILEGEI